MSNQEEILGRFAEEHENQPENTNMGEIQAIPHERIQTREEQMREHFHTDERYKDNLGWSRVDTSQLPTKGLFYPEDAVINIRAARGAEIKHWSTINDQDANRLNETDDIVNYIIERCVVLKSQSSNLGWKDLKEVDRFYLLLSVRELTFIPGTNDLMVPLSESKDMPLMKEMVDFITIPDGMMKYYSNTERCFVMPAGNREMRIYIPSIGVSQWLKNYALAKQQVREVFDQDFIQYAAFLIANHRNLTQKTYEDMVSSTQEWGVEEWSLLSHIKGALIDATNPEIKYNDENGQEVRIPFTFRGGLKSIFVLQNSLF